MCVEIRIKGTIRPKHLAQDLYVVSQIEYCRGTDSYGEDENCGPHVDRGEKTWYSLLFGPSFEARRSPNPGSRMLDV
jgi:hypothetical protein